MTPGGLEPRGQAEQQGLCRKTSGHYFKETTRKRTDNELRRTTIKMAVAAFALATGAHAQERENQASSRAELLNSPPPFETPAEDQVGAWKAFFYGNTLTIEAVDGTKKQAHIYTDWDGGELFVTQKDEDSVNEAVKQTIAIMGPKPVFSQLVGYISIFSP